VYACQPYDSAHLLDHHGALLIQIGALVDLQNELQSTYMSTNQSNQFWLGIFWSFQNLWRFGRSYNNESVPNLISYHYEFFWFFPHFISIFLARKSIFRNFWKWKKVLTCGAWLSVPLAPRVASWLALWGGGVRTSRCHGYKTHDPTVPLPAALAAPFAGKSHRAVAFLAPLATTHPPLPPSAHSR
jgi:hypothetical protein